LEAKPPAGSGAPDFISKEIEMTTHAKWPKLATSALLLSIALIGCASQPSSAPSAATQQRIEAAQTRADHEALAVYYDKEAAAARATAAEHRKMAKSYQTYQAGRGGGNMPAHCNAIVRSYEGIATEFDAMAADHRRMAGQAKS